MTLIYFFSSFHTLRAQAIAQTGSESSLQKETTSSANINSLR